MGIFMAALVGAIAGTIIGNKLFIKYVERK